MFGVVGDDLGVLSLCVYLEPDFVGFMLLVFIFLVVSCGVGVRFGQGVCIEYVVLFLRNLRCRVFGVRLFFVRLLKSRGFYLKRLML
jgi:hypothetical protein